MTSHTEKDSAPATSLVQKSKWRRVLGQYPTGVTIITSTDDAGAPVGMIVGTFTSVSEEPPLVGFLPQTSSKTFAQIQKRGRFRASVLGDGHESLCRDFFSAPISERFVREDWEYDEFGIPRLADAIAWFDATVNSILPAGDHVMVLGAVEDLGLGARTGGMPLLFLNGGYGSFTVPRLEFNINDLGSRLRLATGLGDVVQRLSRDLGVECSLSTVVREEVVVLTAADIRSPYVGTCFPFAAPMAPGFAAWCTSEQRQAWTEKGRHLMGSLDEALVEDTIEIVRENGYAISFGHTMSERFDAAGMPAQGAPGALAPLWKALSAEYAEYRTDRRPERHATVLQVPVFGPDSFVALELVVSGFGPDADVDRFGEVVSTALGYGRQITEIIGGTPPMDYQPRLP